MNIDDKTKTELEAAAFRRLLEHLRTRTDVQNIDMMNLAGFCRNCLSRWYREEAGKQGIEVTDPKAREIVYGAGLPDDLSVWMSHGDSVAEPPTGFTVTAQSAGAPST
jgi:hypothetical protein